MGAFGNDDRSDLLSESYEKNRHLRQEWVKVTAKVAREYFADYKGEGPVLHAISVEKAKAPKDPVISFN